MTSSATRSLSSVPNTRIIDFEIAELRKVPFEDSLYLWVRGMMPLGDYEVELCPRVYHDCPEYWGIEVAVVKVPENANDPRVDIAQPGFEALVFERSIPLDGITGSRGITVIGANQIKRIEITGESF